MTLVGVNFSTLLRQWKEARKEAKSTASNTNKITLVQDKKDKWYRNKLSNGQLGIDLTSDFSNKKKPICVNSAEKNCCFTSSHHSCYGKRVRKHIAKIIVKEDKSLTTEDLGLVCKVQKISQQRMFTQQLLLLTRRIYQIIKTHWTT